ncbi:MAG: NAD-dependent epimerase/dehydratase family protein [Rickettsiales endosymbiont of Dermacentor nuttalli]
MNNNSVILITGGNGVLGTATRHKFKTMGLNFLAPTRQELNLLDLTSTCYFIKKHKPDIVIHLAATVFGLGGHIKNQMNVVVSNTTINNNLFSALYNYPPQKIFYAGTVASYPYPFKSLPLKEEDFFDGLPHSGEFGYAMAKRHAYSYLRILQEEKNVAFIYGIFTNMFGINDKFNIETSHVIPSLIAKAFQAKTENTPLKVWGNGEATRDFLCVDDAANAIYFLLNQVPLNDIINISTGVSCSIKEASELIYKAANLDQGIIFLPNMPSGISHRYVDNKKLISLGFSLNNNFETEIHNTYKWYALNKGNK